MSRKFLAEAASVIAIAAPMAQAEPVSASLKPQRTEEHNVYNQPQDSELANTAAWVSVYGIGLAMAGKLALAWRVKGSDTTEKQ